MTQNIPVDRLNSALLAEKGVELLVLREDLIHPFVSGNKWRKLRYNLEYFRQAQKKHLITFGGRYSNHLVAVAASAYVNGISCTGIVRGEDESEKEYLNFMRSCGMHLHFISRTDYRNKQEADFLKTLIREIPVLNNKIAESEILWIPEGGSNEYGVKGCEEIINSIAEPFDILCCPVATAATLAGIARSLPSNKKAIGFAVLRAQEYLEKELQKWEAPPAAYTLLHDYHFNGYARCTAELKDFCIKFSGEFNIPVEPIYTGKMFYGLMDLVQRNYFPRGTRIMAMHTGGIFDFQKRLQNCKEIFNY